MIYMYLDTRPPEAVRTKQYIHMKISEPLHNGTKWPTEVCMRQYYDLDIMTWILCLPFHDWITSEQQNKPAKGIKLKGCLVNY